MLLEVTLVANALGALVLLVWLVMFKPESIRDTGYGLIALATAFCRLVSSLLVLILVRRNFSQQKRLYRLWDEEPPKELALEPAPLSDVK